MNKTAWYTRIGIILFWLMTAAFTVFFVYMASSESISVYESGQHHNYSVLTDLEPEFVTAADMPAQMQKIYRWNPEPENAWEDCLLVYFAHHDLQVYFDDALVYSLSAGENNRIGANVGSNWCAVHLGQNPPGTQVTLVMTPLFESAVDKFPEIYFGAHYSIAMDVLRSEFPLMVFSALCFFLGFVLVAVSLYFHYVMDTSENNMMYLGLCAIFLGFWKITDLASTAMLLPQDSMAIGYISIGCLFLTGPSLMLYCSTLFTEKGRLPLMVMFFISIMVCIAALMQQLLGIGELCQNLRYCHGILAAAILSVPMNCACNRMICRRTCLIRDKRLVPLLILLVGIIMDLLIFYRTSGTGLLGFAIVGFVIYALIVFTGSIQSAARKAYTDVCTGLVNRIRWNEMMYSDTVIADPYCFVMIDLNGLKRVNDTLGHEAGDQMIFQLANLLRSTLPRSSMICRWGGDEFAVLLYDVTRPMLDRYIDDLFAAGARYNENHPDLPISFSLGAALSTEHPSLSRTGLFRLADERMYHDKQKWYAHR